MLCGENIDSNGIYSRVTLVASDLTQSEIGEVYDVSDKTVRRLKNRRQDELEELGLLMESKWFC